MNLQNMELEEFLCSESDNAGLAALSHERLLQLVADRVGPCIGDLGSGYRLHTYANQKGDVLLLHEREVVGLYWGEALVVRADHRGKGLSVPLVLAAIVDRPPPVSRKLSPTGRRALEKAWRVANGHEQSAWTPKPCNDLGLPQAAADPLA